MGMIYLINYWQPTDSAILQRFYNDGTRDENTGPEVGTVCSPLNDCRWR